MRPACGLLAAFVAFAGCGSSSPQPREAAPPSATRAPQSTRAAEAPRRQPRDLTIDERFGGHTLQRHVGRTDAQLAERLRRERGISAASTYTDRETASIVIAESLAESKAKVDAWGERSGPRPNLVLHYRHMNGPPIGRTLERGARDARPCHSALVVLRWDERERQSYVLTSYPESDR
jgi:hypothetical protein